MRGLLAMALAGLVLIAPAPGAAQGAESATPTQTGSAKVAATLESFVDGAVGEAMARDHIAGVTVAVVQGGRPILLKGYGVAGLSPARPVDPVRTPFRIGSVSKVFTWMVVMEEVERGRLRLDEPIDDVLPTRLKTADARFAPIRLIDLMSHSAGYENRDIGRVFARDPARVESLGDYLAANRPARVRQPGRISTYSNYGAALAGYIAARAAGRPFESLVEDAITRPLGMADTSFREPYPPRKGMPTPMPAALAARVSDGFVWAGARFRPQPFEHILLPPAGSASATAADMARLMQAQLRGGAYAGGRLYGEPVAHAFRSQILSRPAGLNGWAHGLQVFQLPGGHTAYGHGGATEFFFTNLLVIPDLDLGIFVSTNTNTGDAFATRFPKAVVEHLYPTSPPPTAKGDAALTSRASRYDGTYMTTRRAYSGLQLALSHFVGAASVGVTHDGLLATRTGSTRLWTAEARRGVFKAVDGDDRILFQFDRDGRAIRWLSSSGTTAYERVGPLETAPVFFAAALAALVAAAATWIGLCVRRGTPPPGRWQGLSDRLSLAVAGVWLLAFAALGLWAPGAAAAGEQGWPGAKLVFASWAGLVASLGAMLLLLLAPTVWATPAASQGWSLWRKLRHTSAIIVYLTFGGVLALWGALNPWNS